MEIFQSKVFPSMQVLSEMCSKQSWSILMKKKDVH